MPQHARARRTRSRPQIIGFTSAIAAYGAFFIPKSYGTSISFTGGPQAALWCFLVFYLSCIGITWWFYTRRGGLLHDIERGTGPAQKPAPAPQPAEYSGSLT